MDQSYEEKMGSCDALKGCSIDFEMLRNDIAAYNVPIMARSQDKAQFRNHEIFSRLCAGSASIVFVRLTNSPSIRSYT